MASQTKKKLYDLETLLSVAIHQRQWERLLTLLEQHGPYDEQCGPAVEKAVQKAPEEIVCRIIPLCPRDKLETMLTYLARRCLWEAVHLVLMSREDVREENSRWAIEKAITDAPVWSVNRFIPLLDSKQLDRVTEQLVKRGLWAAADEVLQRGVNDSRRRWAVGEASQNANDVEFAQFVLPHCRDDELESALTNLVARRLWNSVSKVLQRGVSDSRHRWAVEEAVKNGDKGQSVTNILLRCADDQVDSVVKLLATQQQWEAVGKVLQRGVSVTSHWLAVEEGSKYAGTDDFITCILPHCTDNEMSSVLKHLITRHLWEVVSKVLQRGVSVTSHRLAVEEGSKYAVSDDFVTCILPHCTDNEMSSVLKHLITRHLWEAVSKVLQRDISDTQHKWAVEETIKRAGDDNFVRHILPHCNDEEMDSVVTHLVTRHLWEALGQVLKQGVSATLHSWAVEEAVKHAEDDDFVTSILPHLKDEQLDSVVKLATRNQLDSVLKTLVDRRLWKSTSKILQRGVSDTQHKWAMEEAAEHADGDDFVNSVLPHCADDQLDSVLRTLVSRRLWKSAGTILQRGVSNTQHKWAMEEAANHADGDEFVDDILPHCADDQLSLVVKPLITRHQWKAVGKLLQRGVSRENFKCAAEEACKEANEEDFLTHILPNCPRDDTDFMYEHLVKRGLWEAVDKTLRRSVRWKQITEEWSAKIAIIPAEQLDSVLTYLVNHSLWRAVGMVLKRDGVTKRAWAIEEASRRARESAFIAYILRRCSDDHLVFVLTRLVNRRLWRSVGKVLQLGNCNKTWATGLAEDELESALEQFVKDRLWCAVGEALHGSVSDTKHRWAIEEASKSAKREDLLKFILPHCSGDQLDCTVTHLVTRRLWKTSSEVLQRGVSDAKHNWVVVEASKQATEESFLEHMLPRCSDDQLGSVLLHLVKRNLWASVEKVLKRGAGDTRLLTGIEEASGCARVRDLFQYILPHCANDHLGSVLTQLARRCEWKAFIKVFHRSGVTEAQRTLAVEEACKYAEFNAIRQYILPRCQGSYVTILRLLEGNGRWQTLKKCIHNVVFGTLCRWVEHGKGKTKCENQFVQIMEDFRVDASNTGSLLTVMEQDTYSMVSDLSNRFHLKEELCKMLLTFVFRELCVALCSNAKNSTDKDVSKTCVSKMYTEINSCIEMMSSGPLQGEEYEWIANVTQEVNRSSGSQISSLSFVQYFSFYYTSRTSETDDDILLTILAVLPLFPELQSMALRLMLRQNRWDVISHASLSQVWEEDRRQLFQSAVKQRRWSVVKRWADHTLYDDQLQWAKEEAVKDNQHDVCLLLDNYGLTLAELTQVHSQHGMDAAQKNSLFSEMMERQKWGVCRVLLERGLSVEFCLSVLPELMEMNQWTLVARVMEHEVDSSVRRQVLQRALERNEGSVVWLCMTSVPTSFSADERGAVFQRAFRCVHSQILEGLVGMDDDTGSSHLLEATQLALKWSPHRVELGNADAETELHAACLAGCWKSLYHLVAWGVDPLAVNDAGQSALMYAVRNKDCPQRIVAECISLGFTTHQPSLTNVEEDQTSLARHVDSGSPFDCPPEGSFTSPFLFAVLRGLPVVRQMMYESGACSNRECFVLYKQFTRLLRRLRRLMNPDTESGRQLLSGMGDDVVPVVDTVHRVQEALPYLKEKATLPRSLESSCRLVIAHNLNVRGNRQLDVQQLGLLEHYEECVMFTDLTREDFGKDVKLADRQDDDMSDVSSTDSDDDMA